MVEKKIIEAIHMTKDVSQRWVGALTLTLKTYLNKVVFFFTYLNVRKKCTPKREEAIGKKLRINLESISPI